MLLNIISIYFFIAISILIYFIAYATTSGKSIHLKIYTILSVSVVIYIFGYMMELHAQNLDGTKFWNQFQYLTLPFLSGLWFILALTYTKKFETLLSFPVFAVLFIPTLTFILRITNEYHFLFYTDYKIKTVYGINIMLLEKGIAFYVQFIYILVVTTITLFIFYSIYSKNMDFNKIKFKMLFIASLIPTSSMLLMIIDPIKIGLDYSAIFMPFSICIIGYTIVKYDFFEIKGLARKQVFEDNIDGMILLNHNMRVVDYNINAKLFFNLHDSSIDEIFTDKFKTDKPKLYEIFNSKNLKTYETGFELSSSYWEIRTKTVSNSKNVVNGHLKIIRNITETIHVQNNLEKIANTDFLSKLNNRRKFMNIGSKMIESASHNNTKSKLCMLMIDIDNFKLVNDTFGHHVGDVVIEKIGLYLSKNFRDLDLTSRIGGEEFAVIMHNTDAKLAYEKAESLRKAIENSNIIDEDKSYKLTISIGISLLKEGMTLKNLIREADIALYKAKDTGRNKICY